MTDAPDAALWRLVETWHQRLRRLRRPGRATSSEEWAAAHRPRRLDGARTTSPTPPTSRRCWRARPRRPSRSPPAPHVRGPMGHYTEQGVLARRDRDLAELADEIEQAVATRHADAASPTRPPTRRRRARGPRATSAGSVGLLLRNRPFDVWLHDQDVRRAVGRPGGYDSPAAAHTLDVLGARPADGGRQAGRPAAGQHRAAERARAPTELDGRGRRRRPRRPRRRRRPRRPRP